MYDRGDYNSSFALRAVELIMAKYANTLILINNIMQSYFWEQKHFFTQYHWFINHSITKNLAEYAKSVNI